MNEKEKKEIRSQLHLLKPKSADHFKADLSNIDDILAEYDKIFKIGRELVIIDGMLLSEGLATQPNERQFFGYCACTLRRIVKTYEARLAASRGKLYYNLMKTEPRDISDRALNQIVDSNDGIYEQTMLVIRLREYYERFSDLVEAYNQRGFSLNNLTKAMAEAIANMEINE